jgi:hypothetical protein
LKRRRKNQSGKKGEKGGVDGSGEDLTPTFFSSVFFLGFVPKGEWDSGLWVVGYFLLVGNGM